MNSRLAAGYVLSACLVACADATKLRGHRMGRKAGLDTSEVAAVVAAWANALQPGPQKDLFYLLRPCAACHNFRRFGEAFDGGYVMCTDGLNSSTLKGALSYGINGFDGWGMAMASNFSVPLHEYDCYNPQVPAPCAGCRAYFHKECITYDKSPEQSKTHGTLSKQLLENNLSSVPDRALVLKMDVEGAEWKFFSSEPVQNLRKMRQMIVEFHGIKNGSDWPLYLSAARKIEAAGFVVAHLHGNNWGGGPEDGNGVEAEDKNGNFWFPSALEVTYVVKPTGGCAIQPATYLDGLDETNSWMKAEVYVETPPAHPPVPRAPRQH